MIGYGFRWTTGVSHLRSFRSLSPLQRVLVGEEFEQVAKFQVHCGKNPLKEWCEEHGISKVRHPKVQHLEN